MPSLQAKVSLIELGFSNFPSTIANHATDHQSQLLLIFCCVVNLNWLLAMLTTLPEQKVEEGLQKITPKKSNYCMLEIKKQMVTSLSHFIYNLHSHQTSRYFSPLFVVEDFKVLNKKQILYKTLIWLN